MHLKSHSGPIHVLLVNKDTEETSPVVVQVPPPKEEDAENQNVDPNQAQNKSRSTKVRDSVLFQYKVWNFSTASVLISLFGGYFF